MNAAMMKSVAALMPALLLTACANLTPAVTASAGPDAEAGYIAGLFNRNGWSFAIRIRAVDGAEEYVMPMGEDTRLPADLLGSTVAIKVRPGRYAVSGLFTYTTLSKEIISKAPGVTGFLGAPFDVKPGAVTHLGEFTVESKRTGVPGKDAVRYDMRVHPHATLERDVAAAFRAAYPKLAGLEIRCLPCAAGAP